MTKSKTGKPLLGYFTFRLESEKVMRLRTAGVNMAVEIRHLVDKLLDEERCPACKQRKKK